MLIGGLAFCHARARGRCLLLTRERSPYPGAGVWRGRGSASCAPAWRSKGKAGAGTLALCPTRAELAPDCVNYLSKCVPSEVARTDGELARIRVTKQPRI